MSEVEEDRIDIVITADTGNADSAIEGVEGRLRALGNAARSASAQFDQMFSDVSQGQGFKSMATAIANMSDAMKGLRGAQGIISGVADGMQRLSDVPAGQFQTVGNGIGEMARGIGSLESVDADKLNSLANAVGALPDAINGMSRVGTADIASVKQSLDGIADAGERAAKVGTQIGNLGRGLRDIPEGLDSFASNDYSKGLESFDSTINALLRSLESFDKDAQRSARGFSNLANGLSKLNSLGTDTRQLDQNLDAVTQSMARFVAQLSNSVSDEDISRFSQLANAVWQVAEAYSKLAPAQAAVNKAAAASGSGFFGAVNNINGILSALQPLSAFADKLQGVAGSTMTALGNGAQRYLSLMWQIVTVPIDNLRSRLDGLNLSMGKLVATVGRIVMYRAMRSALSQMISGVTTGVQNLYQWALLTGNQFVSSMDSMASSVQYFQNSVGAAASGLLDAMAPAIEQLINYLVSALNAVNQLIAALTGHSTWRRAVRVQKAFADAAGGASDASGDAADAADDAADAADSDADSTKGATKAAEDYQNTVLGFDELNKMNAPDDGSEPGGGSGKRGKGSKGSNGKKGNKGKGGSGGSPDYGVMFEDVPIDSWAKDLANTDDWTKLGEDIANALNNWERSIDWDSIDKTAAKWSKRVWTAFNGFVHARDWSLFGYTIARGLNVGLHFIDDIAQHADFTYFGAGIAAALNQAVQTIDWPALGRVMTDGAKTALETLHGFLNGNDTYAGFNFERLRQQLNVAIDAAFGNINWQQAVTDVTYGLGEVAATFVSGVSRVAADFNNAVQNTDWVSWGQQVGSLLNLSVSQIDWASLGQFLTDGLKMALEGLHGALQTFDWTALGNGIETMITNAFNSIDWAQAGTDINNLANHLLDVVEQAIAAINWDDVNTFIDGLNIPQLLTRALGDIAALLGKTFVQLMETNLWPLVLAWVVGKVASLGVTITSEILKWKIAQTLLQQGTTGGTSFGGGFFSGAGQAGLGAGIGQWLTEHVGAAGTTTAATSLGSGLGLALVGGIGAGMNFKFVQDQVDNGFNAGNFAGTMLSAGATGAAIGGAFGGPLGAAIGAAAGGAVGLTETIIANWGPISDWVSTNVGQPLQQHFTDMGNNIQQFADNAGQSWSTFKDDASAAWQTTCDNFNSQIVQPIGDGLSQVAQWATDRGTELGDNLGNALSGGVKFVGDGAKSLYDTIHDHIGDAVNNASGWGSDVSSKVGGGISGAVGWVSNAAGNVATNIRDHIGDAVNKASGWGRDVSDHVGSGISGAVGWVSNAAGNVANDIKNKIVDGTNAARDWGSNVPARVSGGINGGLNWVWGAAGNIAGSVRDQLSNLGGKALSWGRDIVSNIANGISNGIGWVANAASNVASTISSYIHFSEPDVGPLANFHTFMPDMMQQLASGIERYVPEVKSVVDGLASDMGDSLSLESVMPNVIAQMESGLSRFQSAVISMPTIGAPGTQQQPAQGGTGDVLVDALTRAVERGIMSVAMGQSSNSHPDQGRDVVIRIDSEELARATMRGMDRMNSRLGIAFS